MSMIIGGPADEESKGKQKNIVLSLINDFGGPLAIITASESVLNLVGRLSNNKSYQKLVSGLRMTLPAAIIGYKTFDSIKNYYENKGNKNVTLRKNHRILKIMNYTPFEYERTEHSLSNETLKLGPDITHWLLRSPKTKSFDIEGYYDENFNQVENVGFDKGTFYVAIKKDNNRFVLELEIVGSINNKLIIINSSLWFLANDYEYYKALKKHIILDFVDNFNTIENTVIYTSNGLDVRAKISVDYEINQFDVYKLAKEIKSVINKKKKRGYIFAGVPGTGKFSIILKLESLLKDYPILYVSKSSISYSGDLNEVFSLINTLSPCIVIFEDLDCFGFGNKGNKFFNEFLAEIDNIYEKYNTVIIATLNDTGEVHQSLINRPGRVDQVFLINPPNTREEVYTVMSNKYSKSTKEQMVPIESINNDSLDRIIGNSFTQADVCELVEKIIINDKQMDNDSLLFSINELESSKKAIKACNFSKEVKDKDEDDAGYPN